MSSTQLLQGNIVVTGGTKGIGKATIELFASKGYDIITCSRGEKELKDLKIAVESKYNVKVTTAVADLSKKSEVIKFGELVNEVGDIAALVNNTGVFIPGKVSEEEDGVLEMMIDTNLYSAYHLTRMLLNNMITRKSGHIINMCSTASITPYINGGSYCISKYAMYGMTKVLREEMKEHNIRVSAIMPGPTFTASWEGVDIDENRFIDPKDVADSVWTVFSASERTVIEDVLIRPQLGDL